MDEKWRATLGAHMKACGLDAPPRIHLAPLFTQYAPRTKSEWNDVLMAAIAFHQDDSRANRDVMPFVLECYLESGVVIDRLESVPIYSVVPLSTERVAISYPNLSLKRLFKVLAKAKIKSVSFSEVSFFDVREIKPEDDDSDIEIDFLSLTDCEFSSIEVFLKSIALFKRLDSFLLNLSVDSMLAPRMERHLHLAIENPTLRVIELGTNYAFDDDELYGASTHEKLEKIFARFAEKIAKHPSLEALNFRRFPFHPVFHEVLAEQKLSRIKRLGLRFPASSEIHIVKLLGNCAALKSLALWSTDQSTPFEKSASSRTLEIFRVLPKLKTLEKLVFQSQTPIEADHIAQVGKCGALKTLELAVPQVSDIALAKVMDATFSGPELAELRFAIDRELESRNVDVIVSAIEKTKSLRVLDFGYCQIDPPNLRKLVSAAAKKKALELVCADSLGVDFRKEIRAKTVLSMTGLRMNADSRKPLQGLGKTATVDPRRLNEVLPQLFMRLMELNGLLPELGLLIFSFVPKFQMLDLGRGWQFVSALRRVNRTMAGLVVNPSSWRSDLDGLMKGVPNDTLKKAKSDRVDLAPLLDWERPKADNADGWSALIVAALGLKDAAVLDYVVGTGLRTMIQGDSNSLDVHPTALHMRGMLNVDCCKLLSIIMAAPHSPINELRLWEIHVDDKMAEVLAPGLARAGSLKILDLSGNKMSPKSEEILIGALQRNRCVTHFIPWDVSEKNVETVKEIALKMRPPSPIPVEYYDPLLLPVDSSDKT